MVAQTTIVVDCNADSFKSRSRILEYAKGFHGVERSRIQVDMLWYYAAMPKLNSDLSYSKSLNSPVNLNHHESLQLSLSKASIR
jgi:hypothetical protein